MRDNEHELFDFSRYAATDLENTAALIRRFAAHDGFRSAVVEELELDNDFYRRPVRPEDLSFIRFSEPVIAETVTQLPFLAAQRLLLCINELDYARLPQNAGGFDRFAEYYCDTNRILGAQVRPFLENFAFDFLAETPAAGQCIDQYVGCLEELLRYERSFWFDTVGELKRCQYVREGIRFALIQKSCLAPSKRAALARAVACGSFEGIAGEYRPQFVAADRDEEVLKQLGRWCGITKREHSYWQFYLSTSLAECNLLHALAVRPDRALSLCGAAFAAEGAWMAFREMVVQVGADLALGDRQAPNAAPPTIGNCVLARFRRTLDAVVERFGERGLREVGQGLRAMEALAGCARENLREQLVWLASVEDYRAMAQAISARIEMERPDIDRETFVEPREMCSTTHVHDDHRLVVIESGRMVFWGNLGMKLRLEPGEMVLVPQGRLHGSSIESESCTYHQPIIPDAWIQEQMRAFRRRQAAE